MMGWKNAELSWLGNDHKRRTVSRPNGETSMFLSSTHSGVAEFIAVLC